jgi:hypothetical protein
MVTHEFDKRAGKKFCFLFLLLAVGPASADVQHAWDLSIGSWRLGLWERDGSGQWQGCLALPVKKR